MDAESDPSRSAGTRSAALILIDHGSRREEANGLLECVAGALAARSDYIRIVAAHMELAEPTLDQAFDLCVRDGASRVIIVPYFLAQGRHMTEDIPAMARSAAARHPGVAWSLADPLGFDDRMIDILIDRARAAESGVPSED